MRSNAKQREMKTLIQGSKVQHKTLFIFYTIKILVK